jgi:hypothetical protein
VQRGKDVAGHGHHRGLFGILARRPVPGAAVGQEDVGVIRLDQQADRDSLAVGAPFQVCPTARSPRPGAIQVRFGGSFLTAVCGCEA